MLGRISTLYFYGNIHISVAAALLVIQSYLLAGIELNINYILFVFGSTLGMYCIHRLIGLNKMRGFEIKSRFDLIRENKVSLITFTLMGLSLATIQIFQLDLKTMLLLSVAIPPCIAYVVPLLPSSKRLRDIHFVKIFLIAFVWSWVCVGIPCIEIYPSLKFSLLTLEMVFFIFAITIPFDIRDKEIDQSVSVKTLPITFGIKKSIKLAQVLLVLSSLMALFLSYTDSLDLSFMAMILLANFVSYTLVSKSTDKSSDLFFTVFIDGMIVLRSILVILAKYF